MSGMTAALVLVLLAGLAIGAYAYFAPRRAPAEPVRRPEGPPLQTSTAWTQEAGDEFAGLSESRRCDLVFAVAALDDERSRRLLEHALDDPADAVATAAAHALAASGRRAAVEAFLARNPGPRADRIAQTLALLD
ncbi:MAG: hypothetical protein KGN02_08670 [bacterium]|nr:hypothetical protein [bacterium]